MSDMNIQRKRLKIRYEMNNTTQLLVWMGNLKLRDIFHIFITLTWLSSVIYIMLGQLVKTRIQPKHHHSPGNHTWGTYTDLTLADVLRNMGFVQSPKLYNKHTAQDDQHLVFAILVQKHQMDNFYEFLGSFKLYFAGRKLIVYDVGIPEEDIPVIQGSCQCIVRTFHWDLYPGRIRNPRFRAFTPLMIQEMLQEFSMVFWCEPTMRFRSSDIKPHIKQAKKHGLVSWSTQQYPTSALTHYNMFRYFNTTHSDYYFHRTCNPNIAIYINTAAMHYGLMLPWVKCALDLDCLAPIGSQPGGCNYMHKPKYIYAGCHHYVLSAFNIILGILFKLDTPYYGKEGLFVLNSYEER